MVIIDCPITTMVLSCRVDFHRRMRRDGVEGRNLRSKICLLSSLALSSSLRDGRSSFTLIVIFNEGPNGFKVGLTSCGLSAIA